MFADADATGVGGRADGWGSGWVSTVRSGGLAVVATRSVLPK